MLRVYAVAGAALAVPTLTADPNSCYMGFLVFEVCVGVYFPAMGTMKARPSRRAPPPPPPPPPPLLLPRGRGGGEKGKTAAWLLEKGGREKRRGRGRTEGLSTRH